MTYKVYNTYNNNLIGTADTLGEFVELLHELFVVDNYSYGEFYVEATDD